MKRLQLFTMLLCGALAAETALQFPNAGFEEKAPAWKLNQLCRIIPEAAHTGKFGLRIEDDLDTDGASVFAPRIDVAGGTDIVVRFWARSIANGQKTGIYLRFVDAKGKSLNGQKLGNDNITYVASGATAWREHIAIAKAPANATQLALWIHSVNNAFSKADIDDFSIAVITPEEAAEIKKTIAIQKLNAAKPAAFPVPTAERIAEIAAMLPEMPTGPCPKASDRTAWQPLMDTPAAESIIKRATAYIGVEPPPLTDEGYLEFSQNGNRSRFESVYFQRTTRLNLLALAETLEYKGRFIPTLESDIHAICNEKSWNLPAHDKNLNDFYNRSHHAALFSTEIAANLAYTDWWLGEKLSPEIRAEIRRETNRRIFGPYWPVVRNGVIPDGFWWVRGRNNWNAVCHDNLIRAALILLEDRRERAEIIAGAENGMPFYINGYSPDGYCSEGMGYWNYGYGHFLQMAETLLLATDGKLSFYNHPRLEKVAAFARDIQIEENVCPAFADCGVSAKPSTAFMSYIQRRYPSAVFKAIPPQTAPSTSFATTALHCFYDHLYPIDNLPQVGVFPPRSLFKDAGIYIGRSTSEAIGRFGTAFKAGHNGEEHNHNDVGSFTVVLNGKQYFLDPGGEAYTKQTFSKDRYKSQMLNSYGHMVPIVAGKLQTTGAKSFGTFVSTEFSDEKDVIVADIKNAYLDAPSLKSLRRTFTFDRTVPSVTVRDDVSFDSPQTFETCLVTTQSIHQLSGQEYLAYNGKGAVKATVAAEGGELAMTVGEVVNPNRVAPKRIAVAFKQPVTTASITITFTPANADLENLPGFYHAPDMSKVKLQMEKTVTVQAENIAEETGGKVVVETKIASDGMAFKQWNGKGHALSWTVDIQQDATYAVQLRLCHIASEDVRRTIAVDGVAVNDGEPFLLPGTGGWSNTEDNWRNVWLARENRRPLLIPLKAGRHVFTMTNVDDRGLNLDWIKFTPVE